MNNVDQMNSTFTRKIAELQRAQKVADKLVRQKEKLQEQIASIETELDKVVKSEGVEVTARRGRRPQAEPKEHNGDKKTRGMGKRGELTQAIIDEIDHAKHPLKPTDVAKKLELPTKMIRNLLYTSKRFERVGKGSFAVAAE